MKVALAPSWECFAGLYLSPGAEIPPNELPAGGRRRGGLISYWSSLVEWAGSYTLALEMVGFASSLLLQLLAVVRLQYVSTLGFF